MVTGSTVVYSTAANAAIGEPTSNGRFRIAAHRSRSSCSLQGSSSIACVARLYRPAQRIAFVGPATEVVLVFKLRAPILHDTCTRSRPESVESHTLFHSARSGSAGLLDACSLEALVKRLEPEIAASELHVEVGAVQRLLLEAFAISILVRQVHSMQIGPHSDCALKDSADKVQSIVALGSHGLLDSLRRQFGHSRRVERRIGGAGSVLSVDLWAFASLAKPLVMVLD